MAIWGYARVSTDEQNTALQVDALISAGVPKENLIEEQISGAAKEHRSIVHRAVQKAKAERAGEEGQR